MKVQINNIEFTFHKQSSDRVTEDEDLGLSKLFIPGPMSERFRKETGSFEDGLYLFPHYDRYETKDNICGSGHDCYNADTQIVLMNWLFDKKRSYKLEYEGLDPYWLFHDSRHALNDVYNYEVRDIYSYVESERLIEGADFAKTHGISMSGFTLWKLEKFWEGRWRYREPRTMSKLGVNDLFSYLTDVEKKKFDFYQEIEPSQELEDWEVEELEDFNDK